MLQCFQCPVDGVRISWVCLIFLPIGSLLSRSPELQALLMNQLTVKVRVRGCVNAPLYVHFQ